MYVAVLFEDESAVIPVNWLADKGTMCWWPWDITDIGKSVLKCVTPDENFFKRTVEDVSAPCGKKL